MTSSEEVPDQEESPPDPQSVGVQLQITGFDEDLTQRISKVIPAVLEMLSRHMPLHHLSGVTVANDYTAALASIDRGLGEGVPPHEATTDEDIGHEIAMAVPVKRDGKWKTHVVFGPEVVALLVSDVERDVLRGGKTIVHEMAHAADLEYRRKAFGNDFVEAFDEQVTDPKERYLSRMSNLIWDEYFASRMSVPTDPDGEHYEDELFVSAYLKTRDRLQNARRDYHYGAISLEEFLEVLRRNLRTLFISSGYLLGLSDGLEKDLATVAPKSAPLLEEKLGRAIMRFHDVLLALWERDGAWESYDEFLELNRPAEALLNDLDLYVRSLDDGNVYIDIPPRPEHVR